MQVKSSENGDHVPKCSTNVMSSYRKQNQSEKYVVSVFIFQTCWWKGILHKDEDSLLSTELDSLPNIIHELSNCKISRDEVPAKWWQSENQNSLLLAMADTAHITL